MARKTKSERFNDYVVSKFEIYNSLFLTLPFDSIPQTSLLLPLFKDFCSKGYDANLSPKKIVVIRCFFCVKPWQLQQPPQTTFLIWMKTSEVLHLDNNDSFQMSYCLLG